MDIQQLIKMANQIGTFFETLPDETEALHGIAGHLQKFWTPGMRAQMLDHVDREQGAGLKGIVVMSIEAHRSSIAGARSMKH